MLRLRDLREDSDLSQMAVAEFLHVHQTTYGKYEREQANLPNSMLVRLAEFFGTSTDYILGHTDFKTPYPKKLFKQDR